MVKKDRIIGYIRVSLQVYLFSEQIIYLILIITI